jgi:general secretion pathway protein N
MSSNRWRGPAYLAAGLCSYLLFLLITLPAYWFDWLLSRTSSNLARIQQPEGTLWDGNGNLVIQGAGQERLQSRIAWSIQPLWLFTGKLQARLSSRDAGAPLNATLRLGYRLLSISDVEVAVPVSVLSAINPAINLVAPSGRLQFTTPQATLTPNGLEGEIQLTWLGAGARMGGLSEIGDYRMVVNGRGPTAELRIETLHGDVAVTAQGEWQVQGEGLLRLTGNIAPGGREQTLRPLLTMVNAQNNNGQYSWTLNSRFALSKFFWAAQ